MATEIIINAVPEETRVALLDNGVLAELYIDRKRDQGIVGNVYKGRVAKVLPGMQAAFVDIGLERAAFLHVSDIVDFPEGEAPPLAANGEGLTTEEVEDEEEEEEETARAKPKPRRRSTVPIEELLEEGQEIIVQVSKEPMGTKGARVTGHLSFPGRYLVFLPTVNHLGVSRRIGKGEERGRLRELVGRLRKGSGGYIIRTVSEGISDEEIRADMEFLDRIWQTLQEKKEQQAAPSLLHSDLDLSFRVVRDLFTPKVDRLVIDSKTEHERVLTFVQTYMPHLGQRVELYSRDEPIFDAYGIELEISKALGRRVWLKSGGYIVIDHTEALTVIDVNTGRYVGKRNLEETILKTNLEAAKEIAYQLRLRNIGGLIIIDFIDMAQEKHRRTVEKRLIEALRGDRARIKVGRISPFGMLEITRQRVGPGLKRTVFMPCPHCKGAGWSRTVQSKALSVLREVRALLNLKGYSLLQVFASPGVNDYLSNYKRRPILDLEEAVGKTVVLRPEPSYPIDVVHYRFLTGDGQEARVAIPAGLGVKA
jgi:ribonuclease G